MERDEAINYVTNELKSIRGSIIKGDSVPTLKFLQLSEIFKFQQTGFNTEGKIEGFYTATGTVPEFYEQLQKRGVKIKLDIFDTGGRK